MLRKAAIMILGLTLLLTLVLTGLHERMIVVVEDQKSGETKMLFPDTNHFELGYIHSVLLTPVDEFFEITDDNELILQKTIYESFGVGLPYEQLNDADFEIVEGKFILKIKREFDIINMIVSPIPKHTITINGETQYILDLFDGVNHARRIKIYVVTKKVFEIGNYQVVL